MCAKTQGLSGVRACPSLKSNLTMYSGEPDSKPQDASPSVTVARRVVTCPWFVDDRRLVDLSKGGVAWGGGLRCVPRQQIEPGETGGTIRRSTHAQPTHLLLHYFATRSKIYNDRAPRWKPGLD